MDRFRRDPWQSIVIMYRAQTAFLLCPADGMGRQSSPHVLFPGAQVCRDKWSVPTHSLSEIPHRADCALGEIVKRENSQMHEKVAASNQRIDQATAAHIANDPAIARRLELLRSSPASAQRSQKSCSLL